MLAPIVKGLPVGRGEFGWVNCESTIDMQSPYSGPIGKDPLKTRVLGASDNYANVQ